jgi:hypothetical protein
MSEFGKETYFFHHFEDWRISPGALPTTLVFLQWWAFETVPVHRDRTLNEDKNL